MTRKKYQTDLPINKFIRRTLDAFDIHFRGAWTQHNLVNFRPKILPVPSVAERNETHMRISTKTPDTLSVTRISHEFLGFTYLQLARLLREFNGSISDKPEDLIL